MIANRKVSRGDSDNFTIFFNYQTTNNRNVVIKTPIDLTGWTVWLTVRASIAPTSTTSDTDAIIAKKVDTFTNLGQCQIEILPEETDIDGGTYYYDIQYKKPDGSIKSSPVFKYVIVDDVTRGT
jgi:hypothetical protein